MSNIRKELIEYLYNEMIATRAAAAHVIDALLVVWCPESFQKHYFEDYEGNVLTCRCGKHKPKESDNAD